MGTNIQPGGVSKAVGAEACVEFLLSVGPMVVVRDLPWSLVFAFRRLLCRAFSSEKYVASRFLFRRRRDVRDTCLVPLPAEEDEDASLREPPATEIGYQHTLSQITNT